MKKVGIAELKARLSEYVRGVRSGASWTVMDRGTPVARLTPYSPSGEPLQIRSPARRWPSLQKVPLPPPVRSTVDVLDILLEERQGER